MWTTSGCTGADTTLQLVAGQHLKRTVVLVGCLSCCVFYNQKDRIRQATRAPDWHVARSSCKRNNKSLCNRDDKSLCHILARGDNQIYTIRSSTTAALSAPCTHKVDMFCYSYGESVADWQGAPAGTAVRVCQHKPYACRFSGTEMHARGPHQQTTSTQPISYVTYSQQTCYKL